MKSKIIGLFFLCFSIVGFGQDRNISTLSDQVANPYVVAAVNNHKLNLDSLWGMIPDSVGNVSLFQTKDNLKQSINESPSVLDSEHYPSVLAVRHAIDSLGINNYFLRSNVVHTYKDNDSTTYSTNYLDSVKAVDSSLAATNYFLRSNLKHVYTDNDSTTYSTNYLDSIHAIDSTASLLIRPYKVYTTSFSTTSTDATSNPFTFVVGDYYFIVTFNAGDDFSGVTNGPNTIAGTINTTGCLFKATATSTLSWANGSTIRHLTWSIIAFENTLGTVTVLPNVESNAIVIDFRTLGLYTTSKTWTNGISSASGVSVNNIYRLKVTDTSNIRLYNMGSGNVTPISVWNGQSIPMEFRVYN